MIRIMIIDDSPVFLQLLRHILSADKELEVVASFESGDQALNYLENHTVDVITTDLNLPKMNGLEITRRILQKHAIPILVVSGSCGPIDDDKVFQTLEVGALALLEKPSGMNDKNYSNICNKLIDTIKIMSEVKVVRRFLSPRITLHPKDVNESLESVPFLPSTRVVAIGASMGGPQALHALFSKLPKNFPVPILIVQHIAPGFIIGLCHWLGSSSELHVRPAKNGEIALRGTIYLAPDGLQMEIDKNCKIILKRPTPTETICPSVNHLFNSVANSFETKAIGIILTGMGSDGAEGLYHMMTKGAFTIAQDEATATIYGMPKEAFKRGAVKINLPLPQIHLALMKLLGCV